MTTNYYLDGAKILGESRTDGLELRYFYDHDGLIGFRFDIHYYGYIKDGQDNIVAIVDDAGKAEWIKLFKISVAQPMYFLYFIVYSQNISK